MRIPSSTVAVGGDAATFQAVAGLAYRVELLEGDQVVATFIGPQAGTAQGSSEVYPVDILEGHCGPNPRLTWRVFTGEEPGRWTSAGRF